MPGSFPKRRKSLWSQSGPTPRLLFGAFVIATVGLLGLTPKEVFGLSIAWPYAALWGAVGWGRVGLSLRPMLLLIVFGLIQDVTFHAPLGCFVILSPIVLFCGAFLLLWLMASTLEDHPVRILPLIASLITTGIVYAVVHRVFDLGRKPGELAGQSG